jgi:NADP-dependent 3-hydroxy acid dehydrogenase YdfG
VRFKAVDGHPVQIQARAAIAFAIEQPDDLDVGDIVVRPAAQA